MDSATKLFSSSSSSIGQTEEHNLEDSLFEPSIDLRNIIQQKEKELHDINDYRIRTLEQSVRDKETQLHVQRERFSKLKEDFQYNLKLIEDRDTELAKYDNAFSQVKSVLREKDLELSEAKSQVAESESQLKRERIKLQEQESYYNEKLKDLKATMDSSRWSLEDASRRDREAFEQVQAEMQKKMRQREDDMEAQRRDMQAMFDEVSRQKHLEYQKKFEELSDACREFEKRSGIQSIDLKTTQEKLSKCQQQNDELSDSLAQSEKKCKSLLWELEDVRKLKDAKIAELHSDKEEIAKTKQDILNEYESKMNELLTSLHSVEKAFVQQKDQYETRLQEETQRRDEELRIKTQNLESRLKALADKLRNTEEQLDTAKTEATRANWDYQEQLSEKVKQIEQMKREMAFGATRQDSVSADAQNQISERDQEIRSLREKITALREQVSEGQKNYALAKANEEMSMQSLADVRAQMAKQERQHQERLEDRLMEVTTDHNKIVESLQSQRDRLISEKQSFETKLFDLENTNSDLRGQLATAQAQGLVSSRGLFEGDLGPVSPLASWTSNETKREDELVLTLRSENAKLSTALRTMRAEMEELTTLAATKRSGDGEERNGHESDDKGSKARPPIPPRPGSSRSLRSTESTDSTKKVGQAKVFAENQLLHEQATKLHQYISLLQQGQPTDSDELQLLRSLLETQAKQLKLLKENEADLQGGREGDPVKVLQLENAQERLKDELREVRLDLERVIEERDQLAELSNKLRAEVKRSSTGSATAEHIQQIEKQVAETFQAKIKSVEGALEEIVTQNRMLKLQLRTDRIAMHDEIATPTDTLEDIDVGGDGDVEDDDTETVESRSSAMRSAMASRRRDIQQATSPSSFDALTSDLRRARADREEERILGGVVGRRVSGGGGNRPTARERLEEARRRLDLTGTGNNTTSTKKTVKRKSRKKSAASPSGSSTSGVKLKRKVRNYNIRT